MAENVKEVLERIGYSYFKVEVPVSVEELIIQILSGKEKRFLKAIPFVVYLTTKKPSLLLDFNVLLKKAKEKKISNGVKAILNVTLEILKKVEPENTLSGVLKKIIPKKKVAYFVFTFDEYFYDFLAQKKLYEVKQERGLAEKINTAKEYDLQYALQNLFKPKQREIIQKVVDNQLLTKIEYDYYFKTIKKRLRAVKLLGDFADTIIQKKISRKIKQYTTPTH